MFFAGRVAFLLLPHRSEFHDDQTLNVKVMGQHYIQLYSTYTETFPGILYANGLLVLIAN